MSIGLVSQAIELGRNEGEVGGEDDKNPQEDEARDRVKEDYRSSKRGISRLMIRFYRT